MGLPLTRRQTNGWQLYAGWRTGEMKQSRQTRRSPAHSRHKAQLCGCKKACKETGAFACIISIESPNPYRHVDDRRTISFLVWPMQGATPNTFFNPTTINCRSELAREKPEGAVGFQVYRVIVDDLREQARPYRG